MASQLENVLACIMHCWGIYGQNSIVKKNVRVDNWTAKLAIIAINE